MVLFRDNSGEYDLDEIRSTENNLREAFRRHAKVTDLEKGYVSVPFVNQLVDPELQGLASDLVACKFHQKGVDKVVMIPTSGNPLATTVAERLRKPLVLGRKGLSIPGSWQNRIIIEEQAPSFTTGEQSSFVFNAINPGDNILLVDDVIANGDTSSLIVHELRARGVNIAGLAVYFAKLFQSGVQKLREEFGIEPFYVVGIESMNDDTTVNLSPPHF